MDDYRDANCTNCKCTRAHMLTWAGYLCVVCGNRFGPSRGAKKIIAPNGTDGYNCDKCKVFCAYVVSNQMDGGYVCPDCRGAGDLK